MPEKAGRSWSVQPAQGGKPIPPPRVVHAGIGKASFDEAKIIENASAFIEAVRKARPSGAKGTYIRKITLSSTMGVGVAVEDVA